MTIDDFAMTSRFPRVGTDGALLDGGPWEFDHVVSEWLVSGDDLPVEHLGLGVCRLPHVVCGVDLFLRAD